MVTPLVIMLASTFDAGASDKTVDDFSESITISPLHLAYLTLEGTFEYKLGRRIGLGVIAGIGYPGELLSEGGVTFRWYPVGDFRGGMQVGAEALVADATYTVLTAGPFIGGKYIFDFGLTLDGQAGPQVLTSTQGVTSFGLLLNLNVGWSFGKAI
jgi:hypothetical protein